jgi:hypothetical protein
VGQECVVYVKESIAMSTLPPHVSQLINTTADTDPQETQEWLAALEAVIQAEGPDRAQFLLEALIDKTRRSGGLPRQPGARGAPALMDAVECHGHGGAGQSR